MGAYESAIHTGHFPCLRARRKIVSLIPPTWRTKRPRGFARREAQTCGCDTQTLLGLSMEDPTPPLDIPEVVRGLKTWLFEGPKCIGSLSNLRCPWESPNGFVPTLGQARVGFQISSFLTKYQATLRICGSCAGNTNLRSLAFAAWRFYLFKRYMLVFSCWRPLNNNQQI